MLDAIRNFAIWQKTYRFHRENIKEYAELAIYKFLF